MARNVLDLVGNTPLVKLPTFPEVPPGVEVWAKAEWANPGGSVKDRPARRMLLDAIEKGRLSPGKTILDATSGNTGIALAMLGASLGYPVELAMPSNVSEERKQILRAYGATVHASSPFEGSDGAIRLARQLYDANPQRYCMVDQYNNPCNPLAHYETTAPEIWEQTGGRITHFVVALGTSGTCMGTGRRLKELSSAVEIVAVQPESAMHGLEGLKHMASSIVPGIFDPSLPDRTLWAPTEPSYDFTRRMARAGMLVGMSSGANVWGAIQVAQTLTTGVVVTVLCDLGDRYLTTPVYD